MLIEKKIRALKTELDSTTPNTKILQRELQGSLLTRKYHSFDTTARLH